MLKDIIFMKTKRMPGIIVAIAVVVLGFCLASCADNASTVPQAEYSTEIDGHWHGMVANLKETMSIDGDGTFVCQIQPRGFIANVLSQSVPGKMSGTWNIPGAIITLKITGEKHEAFSDRIVVRTSESFKADEFVLKSGRGETSSFQRVRLF
jgi:hypothetical protein